MSTDSLYLALAEEILYCCIQADKIAVREKMKKMIAENFSSQNAKSSFFPQTCCSIHKKT